MNFEQINETESSLNDLAKEVKTIRWMLWQLIDPNQPNNHWSNTNIYGTPPTIHNLFSLSLLALSPSLFPFLPFLPLLSGTNTQTDNPIGLVDKKKKKKKKKMEKRYKKNQDFVEIDLV